MRFTPLLLFILAIPFACSSGSQPAPAGEPVEFPGSSETTVQSGELHFHAPDGWVEERPSSQMRRAQYRLPGQGGEEDAEVAIFVFPGTGGSVQANIDRWIGQFTQPDGSSSAEKAQIDNSAINGLPVTFVSVTGTYNAGGMAPMSGGSSEPQEGYKMLAAIIETSSDPWFLKLTGPEATVDYWENSFTEFVESVHSE